MKTLRRFTRNRFFSVVRIATAGTLIIAAAVVSAIAALNGNTRVSVGSPTSPFSQNKQNEPAIAVDANHPTVLVAGANDNIDLEACNAGDDTTCPFTPGVGVSGVYFSFDSGAIWTQPTYTGYSARNCLGSVGPDAGCTPDPNGSIGTLPWYYENGLVSNGDPAVAFGPVPDENGQFSWDNGSRLYYANLATNFSAVRDETVFKGPVAVAVSRTDDVTTAAAGGAAGKDAWMPPVIVTKQSSTTFSDKEQIWADNASSSPFFGNVYIANASYRSASRGLALPVPIVVSVSTDGGNTWTTKQVTSAVTNNQHGFKTGCTIRTDSQGVVYLFFTNFAVGTPGIGNHVMVKSYDAGHTWTQPKQIFAINDACYNIDPVQGRCVEDGEAGARNDLTAGPSVDIANGAPTGNDATDEVVDAWADGRGASGVTDLSGFNNEKVMLSYSTNGGATWATPTAIQTAGDRGYYAAAGISPNGTDLYVVYNAFTTPYRDNTSDPRSLVGVVLHADITDGVPGTFSGLNRGTPGDPRGSSTNSLIAEFLGDYVYAIATRTYGAGVWNDTRNAADCHAIDLWRDFLRGGASAPKPAPEQDCVPPSPSTFGNSDIFGGSYDDPTP
jgi:BNR repeat-like domain